MTFEVSTDNLTIIRKQYAIDAQFFLLNSNLSKVVYALSIGYVADDLRWPLTTEITLFYKFGVVRVAISGEDRNFKYDIDIFACATQNFKKFRHGRPTVLKWGQQCRPRRTSVARIYDSRR